MATRLEHQAIDLFDKHRDAGFTSSDNSAQIRKLMEEVGEFIEAVCNGDLKEMRMEAGDVAWLLVDIIHVRERKVAEKCDRDMQHHLLSSGMASALNKLQARWE